MWAEQLSPRPRFAHLAPQGAIAERLWSPSRRDGYRRHVSPPRRDHEQLELVGLGHATHTASTLRRLTGRTSHPVLERLLAITMPVSFGQRSQTAAADPVHPARPAGRCGRPRSARSSTASPGWPARWSPPRDATSAARAALLREFQDWRALDGQVTRTRRQRAAAQGRRKGRRGTAPPRRHRHSCDRAAGVRAARGRLEGAGDGR